MSNLNAGDYQNAMVSYNGGLNCNSAGIGQCGDYWYPNYWDTHLHYYQSYPIYQAPEKSKIEQAFKIMQKLMEKKIVEKVSLKNFIETVNEIAGVL
jgi:hypothetical protein